MRSKSAGTERDLHAHLDGVCQFHGREMDMRGINLTGVAGSTPGGFQRFDAGVRVS